MLLDFLEMLETFLEVFVKFCFDALPDLLEPDIDLILQMTKTVFEGLGCFFQTILHLFPSGTERAFDALEQLEQVDEHQFIADVEKFLQEGGE